MPFMPAQTGRAAGKGWRANRGGGGGRDKGWGALDNFVKKSFEGARFSAQNPGWSGISNKHLEFAERKSGISFNNPPAWISDKQLGTLKGALQESGKVLERQKEAYTDLLPKAAENDLASVKAYNAGRIKIGALAVEQMRSHVSDYGGAMIAQKGTRADIIDEYVSNKDQMDGYIQNLEHASRVVAML